MTFRSTMTKSCENGKRIILINVITISGKIQNEKPSHVHQVYTWYVCKQLVNKLLHEQSSYEFQKSSGFCYSDINENL